MNPTFQRNLARLHRFEDWVLTILVVLMVVLAGGQIVLRNVFHSGIAWAEPVLNVLLLWSAMLGAVVATREDQHIGLDFIGRFVHGVPLRVVRFIALSFAAVFCAYLAWFSYGMFADTYMDRSSSLSAGIPAWLEQAILPVGFGLMALRFFIRSLLPPKAHEVPAGDIA